MQARSLSGTSFYTEVAESGYVWAAFKDGGTLACGDRDHAMPFWSTKDRLLSFLSQLPKFQGFRPISSDYPLFERQWIPDLKNRDIDAGLNWTSRGLQCVVTPEELQDNMNKTLAKRK